MLLFSHEVLSACYQNSHTKAQRTTRTEIRTNLSFLVAQKRNRKKLFGCKMSNLATEKTKNGCFRLQFQLKLISATELIFFGFTFSVLAFFGLSVLEISVPILVLVVCFLGWILGSIGIILNAYLNLGNPGILPTTLFETDCY